ncbi:MAG: hypothetical protein QG589_308 [Patescibacteria group bacterium]|nr:hypothetical protein [Patescibacteria group bacterium]
MVFKRKLNLTKVDLRGNLFLEKAMKLSEIPEVILDQEDYKYLLLEIFSFEENRSVLIIRGCEKPGYHYNILWEQKKTYTEDEFRISVIGGGSVSIVFINENRGVILAGKSWDYGREPDRGVTAEILRRHFPVVSFS